MLCTLMLRSVWFRTARSTAWHLPACAGVAASALAAPKTQDIIASLLIANVLIADLLQGCFAVSLCGCDARPAMPATHVAAWRGPPRCAATRVQPADPARETGRPALPADLAPSVREPGDLPALPVTRRRLLLAGRDEVAAAVAV